MITTTPEIESIIHTLTELIAKKKEVEVSNIKPDSDLKALGLDSMDTLDLIFNAEYKFDILFPNDYSEINTLHDVAVLTHQLILNKKQ